VTLFRCY